MLRLQLRCNSVKTRPNTTSRSLPCRQLPQRPVQGLRTLRAFASTLAAEPSPLPFFAKPSIDAFPDTDDVPEYPSPPTTSVVDTPRQARNFSVFHAPSRPYSRPKQASRVTDSNISTTFLDILPPNEPTTTLESIVARLEASGFEFVHLLYQPHNHAEFARLSPEKSNVYRAELRLSLASPNRVAVSLGLLHSLCHSNSPPTRNDVLNLLKKCVGSGKVTGRSLFVSVAEGAVLLSLSQFDSCQTELYRLALVYATHGMLEHTERTLLKLTPSLNPFKLNYSYNSYALMMCYTAQGNFDMAIDMLKMMKDRDGSELKATVVIPLAIKMGNALGEIRPDLLELLDQALQEANIDSRLLIGLASMHLNCGQVERAMKLWAKLDADESLLVLAPKLLVQFIEQVAVVGSGEDTSVVWKSLNKHKLPLPRVLSRRYVEDRLASRDTAALRSAFSQNHSSLPISAINSIASEMLKGADYKGVIDLFDGLVKKEHPKPDLSTVGIVLRAYLSLGDAKGGKNIVSWMLHSGLQMQASTFIPILDLCISSRNFSGASGIITQAKGLRIFEVLTRQQWLEVLHILMRDGVNHNFGDIYTEFSKPNVPSLELIREFLAVQLRAIRFWNRIVRQQMAEVNPEGYRLVSHVAAQVFIGQAEEVTTLMKERIKIPVALYGDTYRLLFNYAESKSSIPEMLHILLEMNHFHLPVDNSQLYSYARAVLKELRFKSLLWPSTELLTSTLAKAFKRLRIPLTVPILNDLLRQSIASKDKITQMAISFMFFPELRFLGSKKPVEVEAPNDAARDTPDEAPRILIIEPNAYSLEIIFRSALSFVMVKTAHNYADRLIPDNPFVKAHAALAYLACGYPSHADYLFARSEHLLRHTEFVDDKLRADIARVYRERASEISAKQVSAGIRPLKSLLYSPSKTSPRASQPDFAHK